MRFRVAHIWACAQVCASALALIFALSFGPAMAHYGVKKTAMTTWFYFGEVASADNEYISNHESYWQANVIKAFGGIDRFEGRKFTPRENPFYCALPYGEYEKSGRLKKQTKQLRWYDPKRKNRPVTKNRWLKVEYKGRVVYCQWEDVGPQREDDWDYVFGRAAKPRSPFNKHAGLDLSPDAFKHLRMNDNDYTVWSFVPEKDVPDGPWRKIITRSLGDHAPYQ